jgi:cytoskeletal protein RodZ
MQTEITDKYDLANEPPPPPTPHFDLASIAEAKPVQPLRRRRSPLPSRAVLRLGTAVLAGLLVLFLGIATMARLNKRISVASAPPETSERADDTVAASPEIETESTSTSSPGTLPLVVTERRRHHGYRHMRMPREVFEPEMFQINPAPVYGRPRARLVTVIQ